MTDTTPDPRPRPVPDGTAVTGTRCAVCAHAAFQPMPACPRCGGALRDATYGPGGTVFASTCLRIPVPGHRAPRGLAYVDLDHGPRILAELTGEDAPLPVGSRVRLVGATPGGDLTVAPEVA